MFCLCQTCCDHINDEDFCLQKMWTSVEIQKALENDYVVKEAYEIYDFHKKIFRDYVNTFLKLEQESSGIPPDCFDENGQLSELLMEYIESYLTHEGILVDREKNMSKTFAFK